MKKNNANKVMALFALIWIVISIIWTWLIVILNSSGQTTTELTAEQIQEIQEMYNSQSWATASWVINTGSWTSSLTVENDSWEIE